MMAVVVMGVVVVMVTVMTVPVVVERARLGTGAGVIVGAGLIRPAGPTLGFVRLVADDVAGSRADRGANQRGLGVVTNGLTSQSAESCPEQSPGLRVIAPTQQPRASEEAHDQRETNNSKTSRRKSMAHGGHPCCVWGTWLELRSGRRRAR